MNTIHARFVSNVVAADAASPLASSSSDAAYMTPESLMAYCESRLRSVDEQVKTAFTQQQKSTNDAAALGELMNAIAKCTGGGIGPGGHCASDLICAYQNAINRVGPDSELGVRLRAELDAFVHTVDKDGHLRAEMNSGEMWTKNRDVKGDGDVSQVQGKDLQQFVDSLKNLQGDLNAGSELSMIRLQSLMSQRQTAIQLTTNLVQSLGDQANKIAANIGH